MQLPSVLMALPIMAFSSPLQRETVVLVDVLTVTNIAPWVATVGARAIDRNFPADVKLGNGKLIPGVSVYGGPALAHHRLHPLIYARNVGGALLPCV
ncbi:hypothetical protein L1987_60026 [Smallanthus sonchifolius]|uniref:Uncharacterized protein n=1 Tax=Smallanthus sonchifolius TaxID=185202 RepID=A0ACB9D7R1_9ASTR|nr:hypothetical protein L1987_60026 [Smallanthus sonchifolius]